jgi:hypothetical protein
MHRALCSVVAVVCALATGPVALAQQSVPAVGKLASPTGETGGPASPVARPQTAWPRILPQSKPGEVPEDPAWTVEEIEQARAHCGDLLKGLGIAVVPLAPIREGECGAPAPVQLISVGTNPPVSFSPPPTLTCDMVAALHRWLEREVQPLARRHLGTPIVGVTTMSSFSCRMAYGRAKGRLSEHGRVNAIDIAGFLTAQGKTAAVAADWGPIAREIATQAAAAQAEAAKKQAVPAPKRDGEKAARPATASAVPAFRPTIEFPAVIIGEPPSGPATGLGWAPSRLGGPKPDGAAADDGKAHFLRAAHRAACTIFATVLGPEANKAHKNHFHLDMSQRKSANICE